MNAKTNDAELNRIWPFSFPGGFTIFYVVDSTMTLLRSNYFNRYLFIVRNATVSHDIHPRDFF